MPITSYLDQLRLEAATLGGNAEADVRRAFAAAGLPSSTYYRAKHGAELKCSTARQVSSILQHWKAGRLAKHGHQSQPAPRTIEAA